MPRYVSRHPACRHCGALARSGKFCSMECYCEYRTQRSIATLVDRVWEYVEIGAPDECWRFTGNHNEYGYGRIYVAGKAVLAHRVVYEDAHGPIADDLVVDHNYDAGCRHRDCCNPSHLRLLTLEENSSLSVWARTTHCPRGHEYTQENTYLQIDRRKTPPVWGRVCRACRKIDQRDRRAATRLTGS